MGNCFSSAKTSEDTPFPGPGRTVGTAAPRAPPKKVASGGRTLGSADAGSVGSPSAKEAAARAAEARAAAQSSKGGALQQKLDAERKMTHNQALAQTAKDNLKAREADAQAQVSRHD